MIGVFSILTRIIFLTGFWMLLRGTFDIMDLSIGLIIAILVSVFSQKLSIKPEEGINVIANIINIFRFLGIFLKDIVKANIQVASLVLQKQPQLEPEFVHLPLKVKTRVARSILGNVISLTPGTLSVEVEEERIIVHVLTEIAKEELKSSPLQDILVEMEGDRL